MNSKVMWKVKNCTYKFKTVTKMRERHPIPLRTMNDRRRCGMGVEEMRSSAGLVNTRECGIMN